VGPKKSASKVSDVQKRADFWLIWPKNFMEDRIDQDVKKSSK
jgi:hypothetical protein